MRRARRSAPLTEPRVSQTDTRAESEQVRAWCRASQRKAERLGGNCTDSRTRDRHVAGERTGVVRCAMKLSGMNAMTSLLLLVAACLEVGGDAIVRMGLKNHTGVARLGLVALGGAVLLGYGIFVNVAPADFGRLLGVYVVLFFLVVNLRNLLLFGIRPDGAILFGGALFVAGGLVITLWKT